jgi:hypothetical protein
VTRFPVPSAIASSATFLVISLLVLAACILPAVQWRFPSEDEGSTEPTEDIKLRIFRKRRQRRKVSPRSESTSPSVGPINLNRLTTPAKQRPRDIKPRISLLTFLQRLRYLTNPCVGVAQGHLLMSHTILNRSILAELISGVAVLLDVVSFLYL